MLFYKLVMTNAELETKAQSYSTRGTWLKDSPLTYQMARRRGILDMCCVHMPEARKCPRIKKSVPERTVEQLVMIASRYQRRGDFCTGDQKAYRLAARLGLIDRCCAHMLPPGTRFHKRSDAGKPMINRIEISDEEIIEARKRYRTRIEWLEGDRKTYFAARRRMPQVLEGLPDPRKAPRRGKRLRIHPDEVRRTSRLCETRGQWAIQYRRCYVAAKSYGIFDECVAHMLPPIDPIYRNYVYAYQFHDHSVYVGQTGCVAVRHSFHLEQGKVLEHAASLGVQVPLPVVLESNVSARDIGEKETLWISRFKKDGWTLLNSSNGGEVGFKNKFIIDIDGGPNRNIILLVGVSGSGKTWITEQLGDTIFPVHGDGGSTTDLVGKIEAATEQDKPIVVDAYFKKSVRVAKILGRINIRPIFVVEDDETISARLYARGGNGDSSLPRGEKLNEYIHEIPHEFSGTSAQVLEWIKSQS